MKHWIPALLMATVLSVSVSAQDAPQNEQTDRGARADRGSRGGDRGARGGDASARGDRGARGGDASARGDRGARGGDASARGDRGARGGAGFSGMSMMRDARNEAEDKIKEKFVAEFEALDKERAALEVKFQELAKKAEVKLPLTSEDRNRKMAAFRDKYKTDLEEITSSMRTDREGATAKLKALYEKEGLEMPQFGAMMGGRNAMPGARGGNEGERAAAPGGARQNPREMLEQLKKDFPQEVEALEKLRAEDPGAYRDGLRKLREKSDAAKKAVAAPVVEDK